MSHPAVPLLSWLSVVIALQFLGGAPLLCLLLLTALLGGGVRRRWWKLLRRARWLLLTLWLILAYGTPGDAWQALSWAPTEAGIYEATLHAARLVAMLGALAALFDRLPRLQLMAALWAFLRPLGALRIEAERLVVRMALVFDYLDKAPPRQSWRHLLDESKPADDGLKLVRIELPLWSAADSGMVVGVAAIMATAVWLS